MRSDDALLSLMIGFGMLFERRLFGKRWSIFRSIFVFELVDFVGDSLELIFCFEDGSIH